MRKCIVCGSECGQKCKKCGIVYKQMSTEPKDFYQNLYYDDLAVRYYTEERKLVFEKIVDIMLDLNIESVLDIGTSTGMMVKIAIEKGINAYGVEFDFPQLRQVHEKIGISDRIIYIEKVLDIYKLLTFLNSKGSDIQCATVLDTLRYIPNFEDIFTGCNLNKVKNIIIKEVSGNFFMQKKRITEDDWYLFSIRSLVITAKNNNYYLERLYLSRFIQIPELLFKSYIFLKIFEFTPTFTLVFQERGDYGEVKWGYLF